jgi:hypothetical protein
VDTGRKQDEVGEIIHSDRFYQTIKYIQDYWVFGLCPSSGILPDGRMMNHA